MISVCGKIEQYQECGFVWHSDVYLLVHHEFAMSQLAQSHPNVQFHSVTLTFFDQK